MARGAYKHSRTRAIIVSLFRHMGVGKGEYGHQVLINVVG